MEFVDILKLVGALFSGGSIAAYITWRRFKVKDNADVLKTYSETQKAIAEAFSIKGKAELLIGEAWMKMAHELEKKNHQLNAKVEQLELALEKEREECDRKMDNLRKELVAQFMTANKTS